MSPVVLGYWADWNTSPTPLQIDWQALTHLCHAFATVAPDGALRLPNEVKSRELTKQGKAHRVSVLLSLGGAESNGALNRACETPAKTANFARALAQAVQNIGYDGIDVDWEAPDNAEEQARMNTLVLSLRRELPSGLLTMATPATNWSGKWFDPRILAPLLDWANVMTYDLYGPWSDQAGLQAGMSPIVPSNDQSLTIPASVQYYRSKKWPSNKIALGIPLYGRGFPVKDWGERLPKGNTAGKFERSYLAYNDAVKLTVPQWKMTRQGGMVCLQKADNSEVFAYDDTQTVKEKAAFARKEGLRGVFFWELSHDFDGKTNTLVRAARAGWGT